ncbi:MAG: carbohydrate ABC transporter permease [Spirochaetota bacterium]
MKTKQITFKRKDLPYLFILPEAVIILVFFFYPAVQAIYQSFLREDPFGLSRTFVGLANYQAIFSNSLYLKSVVTTIQISLFTTASTMLVGLLLAWLVHNLPRSRGYQTMIIWPYALAPAVAGVVWYFLFNPTVGVVAYALSSLGVEWDHLLNGRHALLLVVIAVSWKQVSYNFLFYLAGLKSIPRSLIESATVDGASRITTLRAVVVPMLAPTTAFLLTMNILYSLFESFGTIHQLTRGGPNHATETLVYKVYSDGFLGLNLGGSSAQSVVIMVCAILLTVFQFTATDKKVR